MYSVILADVLARWGRMRSGPGSGHLATGTDEHGSKVQEAAAAKGLEPKEFCDDISNAFQRCFQTAEVEWTDWLRTTQPRHKKAVNELWCKLLQAGHIYKGVHQGWYSRADEAFVPVAKTLTLKRDGKTITVDAERRLELEWIEEENYKFRLSAFQGPLLAWLHANPHAVQPAGRFNEALAEIENGLEDISVSRLRSKVWWGLPVPGDERHVVYVWLDALTVYLTAAGYPERLHGAPLWPASHQFLGKDILKFHAIFWPAFLLAAELPLPSVLYAHGHWLASNSKMSKSLGNVVPPEALLSLAGPDAVRYYMLLEGPESEDASYSESQLVDLANSHLAGQLGNLLSRCTAVSLLADPVVPQLTPEREALCSVDERAFIDRARELPGLVGGCFEAMRFREGVRLLGDAIRTVNQLFTSAEPWRENAERRVCVLALSLEALRVIGILMQPVMPGASNRLLSALAVAPLDRTLEHASWGRGASDREVERKVVLFQRIKQSEPGLPAIGVPKNKPTA